MNYCRSGKNISWWNVSYRYVLLFCEITLNKLVITYQNRRWTEDQVCGSEDTDSLAFELAVWEKVKYYLFFLENRQ